MDKYRLTERQLMDVDAGETTPCLASVGMRFNDMLPYLRNVEIEVIKKVFDKLSGGDCVLSKEALLSIYSRYNGENQLSIKNLRAIANAAAEVARQEDAITIQQLKEELAGYEGWARSVNEALNSGDGTYRP